MVVNLVGLDSYTLAADPAIQGNVLTGNIYFNCNSTAGAISITLPEIADLLWGWNCRIHVIDTAATADSNAITITAGGSDKINGAATLVINQENASAILEIVNQTNWNAGLSSSVNNAKEWEGLVSQAGTAIPTAVVLRNTLGGTIVWTYTAAGIYVGTLTGAFTANKTVIYLGSPVQADAGAAARQLGVTWTSANAFTIRANTIDTSGFVVDANDLLSVTPLNIRVYQ